MSRESSARPQYDAVIVGGGHNGLVCGAYLARAGKRVCVLERRPMLGGAAVSEEIWPGYKVSTASFTMALLQPKVILELELAKFGYEVLKPPPMFVPLEGGDPIYFFDDAEQVGEQIGRYASEDQVAYPKYRAHMTSLAAYVRRFLWETPLDPTNSSTAGRLSLAAFAWRFRDMGEQVYDLYDAMTLSAYDFLSRWFVSEPVKAALGYYAAAGGGNTSMKAPGSAYLLLRGFIRDNGTAAGGSGFIRGGMGQISESIAASGRAFGMVTRVACPVARIIVDNGVATGVELVGGERIYARTVIANASAKTVFGSLLSPEELPAGFLDEIKRIRDKSTAFKVHLGLRRLPRFAAFNSTIAGFDYPAQARLGPSVDYIERAFDASKYGEFSARPCLTVITPSVLDRSIAPEGRHLMSIFGCHAPYDLRGRHWDDARDDLYETAIAALEEHAPDIRECIEEKHVLTPLDIERTFDLHGGHVHHGEISADQIFFRRPVRHYADYTSPIRHLFQCGASTHPGGGVTGVPGHNAAGVILRHLGNGSSRR